MTVPIIDVPGTTEVIAKRSQSIPIVNVPGLDEAIQKRNERPVSPTGKPRVSPSAVPWVLAGMTGAVAGLELAAESLPSPTGRLACRILAVALAGVVGAVSPGLRKP